MKTVAVNTRVQDALAWLERKGSKRTRDEMVSRYGIVTPKAFGVPVNAIQTLGKELGHDHVLAAALWKTGWYEARMLTAFVGEPDRITPAQMDQWAKGFDNWGICDTLCFHLFDRTPHAWSRIEKWTSSREEFVKRAGFALFACMALHDKQATDAPFLRALDYIDRGATDERNFVWKSVSWALRATGRRNSRLRTAALVTARRLIATDDATAKKIGRESLKYLST